MGEVVKGNFEDWFKRSGEILDENDEAMAKVYALSGIRKVVAPTKFGGLKPDEVPPPEPPDIVA